MRMPFSKTDPTDLDAELMRLFRELADETDTTSTRYSQISDQIVKLYKLKETASKSRVSPDAWVAAGSSLLGILFILNFEHAHAFTSKAAAFVMKNR